MIDIFRDFIQQVEPIKLKEPLAKTLGTFSSEQSVLVSFYPGQIPFPVDKSMQIKKLLEKVIWDTADDQEQRQFQDLWVEKVKLMIKERKEIANWLKIEEIGK